MFVWYLNYPEMGRLVKSMMLGMCGLPEKGRFAHTLVALNWVCSSKMLT